MCGIIAYAGARNGAEIVLAGLRRLEYRGYDSWGIASVRDGELRYHKRAGQVGAVDYERDLAHLESGLCIGHVRWATHGGVTDANAHPHLSADGRIAVVHNGIIENYQELRRELRAKGVPLASETDTEVIAHLVSEELSRTSDLGEALRRALARVEGSYAIALLDRASRRLIAARKWSPLVVGLGEDSYYVASDVPAFLEHTRRVVFLADDQMVEVDLDRDGQERIRFADIRTGQPVELTEETIQWSLEQAERGGYAHFTIKEIHEQPQVLENVLGTSEAEIQPAVELIRSAERVYMVACGTALHAAMFATYLFARTAKMTVHPISAGEFPYFASIVRPGDLMLATSQSGETADLLASVRSAKQAGAKVLSVVNVNGSSLTRESDHCILSKAGPEISVVSTKAYVSQLSVFTLIAGALGAGRVEAQAALRTAQEDIRSILEGPCHDTLKEIARTLVGKTCIYSIGRGVDYPSALEWCLKIKEIAYLHGEGFAAGDLKHGPLALIEAGTPVFVIASDPAVFPETLSNAIEAKSRGAMLVGVATEPNEAFDHYLPVRPNGPYGAIPAIVYGQLLAYYLAVEKGLDPDKPRNLAKSVTVK